MRVRQRGQSVFHDVPSAVVVVSSDDCRQLAAAAALRRSRRAPEASAARRRRADAWPSREACLADPVASGVRPRRDRRRSAWPSRSLRQRVAAGEHAVRIERLRPAAATASASASAAPGQRAPHGAAGVARGTASAQRGSSARRRRGQALLEQRRGACAVAAHGRRSGAPGASAARSSRCACASSASRTPPRQATARAAQAPAMQAGRGGAASSAAAVGVGARRSAARSARVTSVSWPTPLTTGIGAARHRAHHPLVVEGPEVLERPAAAAEDQGVDFVAPCRQVAIAGTAPPARRRPAPGSG